MLYSFLEKQLGIAKEKEEIFTVCYIDIDKLKTFNDIYGHLEGDLLIRNIVSVFKTNIRETDIICRMGGDEFIILTPDTNLNGAKELAESIRGIIDEFVFKKAGHLTCSFGISEFINGKSKRELILEAEQALFRSKNKGRNCVTAEGVYDA
jgi:diguanylate cyclase (GGDEF)-like protein